MIVQQINLYQERFHEKLLWLSAEQVAASILIALIVISGWSYLLDSRLTSAQRHSRQLIVDRDRLIAELQTVKAEFASLQGDTPLDYEIETTARKVSARKQVLNFIDGNQFGSGQGFSAYLVALSNLKVENIWLNEIHLGDGFLRIRGSALEASEIPLYFSRFGNESVFQGDHFNLFKINREKQTEWKVDFEIATSEVLGE